MEQKNNQDPTLDQQIEALEKRRQVPRTSGFIDFISQLLYPKPNAPIVRSLPQYDAQGVGRPRNLDDLLNRR